MALDLIRLESKSRVEKPKLGFSIRSIRDHTCVVGYRGLGITGQEQRTLVLGSRSSEHGQIHARPGGKVRSRVDAGIPTESPALYRRSMPTRTDIHLLR